MVVENIITPFWDLFIVETLASIFFHSATTFCAEVLSIKVCCIRRVGKFWSSSFVFLTASVAIVHPFCIFVCSHFSMFFLFPLLCSLFISYNLSLIRVRGLFSICLWHVSRIIFPFSHYFVFSLRLSHLYLYLSFFFLLSLVTGRKKGGRERERERGANRNRPCADEEGSLARRREEIVSQLLENQRIKRWKTRNSSLRSWGVFDWLVPCANAIHTPSTHSLPRLS